MNPKIKVPVRGTAFSRKVAMYAILLGNASFVCALDQLPGDGIGANILPFIVILFDFPVSHVNVPGP